MEGSARILLIARDESQHLVITQNIFKKWAQETIQKWKKSQRRKEY